MSEFKNTKIVSPKEFWDLHVWFLVSNNQFS
jgi:hypothetical protein